MGMDAMGMVAMGKVAMAGGGSGFLGRWARLKAETREKAPEASPEAPVEAPVESTESGAETPVDPSESDAPPPELPDIDTLGKDSDYTVFLQDGVPDEIRNLALRKLWLSDPEFNVLDGLDDYAEDFRTIEEVAEQLAKFGDDTAPHTPEADEVTTAQDGEPPDPDEAPRDNEQLNPEDHPPQTASGDFTSEDMTGDDETAKDETAKDETGEDDGDEKPEPS